MRKAILIGCLMLLPLLAGCSAVSGFLFDVFSDGYTGGGDTRAEKRAHYDQHRQASDHYHPWGE